MLSEISERLLRVAEKKRLKNKLEADLRAVETELEATSARYAKLGIQLEKEMVDVDKLERTSLTSLFYSVLGSREQQLDKERQELLSARLAYQQTQHQLASLRQEREGISQRLDGLTGIESEYEALLAEKEHLVREQHQLGAEELWLLSEQIANLTAEVKEIAEAVLAGKEVLADLDDVIASLESAENWGVWDMFGGGLIATVVKHSRIDDAQEDINLVQAKMSKFKRELADVQKSIELQIDISELASIADILFDGLIVDWIVQSKIENALDQALNARKVINRSVVELSELEKILEGKIAELQQKRVSLLESA